MIHPNELECPLGGDLLSRSQISRERIVRDVGLVRVAIASAKRGAALAHAPGT